VVGGSECAHRKDPSRLDGRMTINFFSLEREFHGGSKMPYLPREERVL
jgi:hypothetical protein